MIIARVFGGLGNQLFIYAAARALSLRHGMPLQFDLISGRRNDLYNRGGPLLQHFDTAVEPASPERCFATRFGRCYRLLYKLYSRLRPFDKWLYIKEEVKNGRRRFDSRLLDVKPRPGVYLDGYWQSEKYFIDYAEVIRDDLKIVSFHDDINLEFAERIRSCNAVSLHARRLHGVRNMKNPRPEASVKSLGIEYYMQALEYIRGQVNDIHVFCFSDYPQWFQDNLHVEVPVTFITHNNYEGDESKNYEDLWLMSQCKHFIIANSTFSWWGAWLGRHPGKIVCVPGPVVRDQFNLDWIPNDWHYLDARME